MHKVDQVLEVADEPTFNHQTIISNISQTRNM